MPTSVRLRSLRSNNGVTPFYYNKFIESICQLAEIKDFRFVFDKCGPMWASVPTIVTCSSKRTPDGRPYDETSRQILICH